MYVLDIVDWTKEFLSVMEKLESDNANYEGAYTYAYTYNNLT